MGRDRPRRELILEYGGHVPMPPLDAGQHLLDFLFRGSGPVKKDGPLEELDVEARVRMLGVELTPWSAETVLRMSQGYSAEMNAALKMDAPPPWDEAVAMWRWVRNQREEARMDRAERQAAQLLKHKRGRAHGDRQ